MRHKLRLIIAITSLIFGFAIGVFWIRALAAGDKWFVQHVVPGKSIGVSHIRLTPKELAIENSWHPEFPGTTAGQSAWEVDEAGWEISHSRKPDDIFFVGLRDSGIVGFAWHRHDTLFRDRAGRLVGAETYRGLLIPLWAVLAISLSPFTLFVCKFLFRRRITRRRQRVGQCSNCGYDLRGVTAICPECGRLTTFPLVPTPA